MKYCIKCGSKIKEDSNYCKKCGYPTKKGKELIQNERNKIREAKKENLILKIGILFIIIAGIIFSFMSWDYLNGLFKVLFIFILSLIFFISSILSKKRGSESGFKSLWFIGMIFIPIILIMIPNYELFGKNLSFYGAYFSVYLAISSLLCIILYYISYKFVKSNIYLYIICPLIDLLLICILVSFNINKYFNNNCDLLFVIVMLFNLIISIVSLKYKNKIFDCFSNYMKILLIITLIFIISYNETSISNFICIIMINIAYIINCYVILLHKKDGVFSVYCPVLITILLSSFLYTIFNNNQNLIIYIFSLSVILQLFISYLLNSKNFKLITFAIACLSIFIKLMEGLNTFSVYKTSIITSILLLLSLLFILKIEDDKNYRMFINIIIPLLIYYFIFTILKYIFLFQTGYIVLIASLLFYAMYYVLKNKNNKLNVIYEILSYTFLIPLSLINNTSILLLMLIEGLWIFYFVCKLILNDKKGVRNFLGACSIINLFNIINNINLDLYYSLLIISALLLLVYLLFKKYKINYNILYIISLILIVIASMFDLNTYNVIGLIFNFILYLVIYYFEFIIKKNHPLTKFIFILIGFNILSNIVENLIGIVSLSNIIILVLYIIILITMYLAEIDDDKNIFAYSILCLIPISNIIENIDIVKNILGEIYILMAIIYSFIFTEKIINFKTKSNKTTIQILIFTLLYIYSLHITSILMTLINLILSSIYLFIGYRRKINEFTYLGFITLIVTFIIKLFTIKNNFILALLLLISGIILVGYVIMKEILKNDKK